MSANQTLQISRRTFLKLAGASAALAAVAAAAACAPTPAPVATSGPAPTTAPAVIVKPLAGRELNIFTANHHDAFVQKTYVPMFQDKTGVKVNYTSIGSGDADAKYAVFVASQDGSQDILYSWETLNAKYGRSLMEDITTAFKPAVLAGLSPLTVKAFTFLGKLYGIPFDSNIFIFMWNKDMYTAAGLDPTKPPESWSQFVDFSKKLTIPGQYATMLTVGDGNASFATFASLFNSTGSLLYNDSLTKFQVDNDAGVQTMQAIYDAIITQKIADPTGVPIVSSIEQGKVFRAGKFAHYIAAPNHFTLTMDPTQSQIVGKAASGIIPGQKLRSGSLGLFEGYGINKFGKNKDVALAFLEHMVSPEVQKQVAMVWGRPPSLVSMYDDADVQKTSPQFATVKEQAKYPGPRYGSPFYFDVGNVFADYINRMLKGEKSPKEAVALIQTESQKLIDAYWAKVK